MLLGGFATLLATPCTAPMIGTALGFAFASGPLGIGLVFTMMALGMSLPYLLFALFPSWTSKLPKPGPWMGAVRSVMGVLLLITALWLLKVMASHAGWDAVLMLAGAICAIVMGSYYYYHRRMNVRFKVAVVVMLVALASVGMFFSGSKGSSSSDRDAGWEAFAPEKIPGYVIEGKLVLVDVTADWCLTCKINKLLVLNGMTQELASDGVVLMQGDWTAPNLAIVSYLASHQRSGIPFNIVHGPGAPEGIILPELLTESSVREALQSAR
jgi:suppressor for copper-sensitivity B